MKKKLYKGAVLLYIIAVVVSGYWFATSINTPEMEKFWVSVQGNYRMFIIGGFIGFVLFIQFRPGLFKMLAFHCLAVEITFAYVLGAQLFDQYKAEVLNWIIISVNSNAWYYSFLCDAYPFIVQSYPVWLPIVTAGILHLAISKLKKVHHKRKEKNKQREIKRLTEFHDKLKTYQLNPLSFLELLSENKKDDYFKAIKKYQTFSEELENRCKDCTARAGELGLNLNYIVHER